MLAIWGLLYILMLFCEEIIFDSPTESVSVYFNQPFLMVTWSESMFDRMHRKNLIRIWLCHNEQFIYFTAFPIIMITLEWLAIQILFFFQENHMISSFSSDNIAIWHNNSDEFYLWSSFNTQRKIIYVYEICIYHVWYA